MYSKAEDEVLKRTQKLINDYHPRLQGARIAVVMRDRASKSGGKLVGGSASKFPEKVKPFVSTKFHFLLELALDIFDDLEEYQQDALIDHQLCHMAFDGNGSPTIISHDIEEFLPVIVRHGLWEERLEELQTAMDNMKQIPFDFGGEVEISALEPALLEPV